MSKTDTSAFRSIAKTNALFGGVQIFNILISIIRSKTVALLLGPSGMGVMGLFNSTIDLIRSLTNCGLQTSAIRDISLANEENNMQNIAIVNKVLSRLVWFTGMAGSLIMLYFAPQLSQFSFSSDQYTNHIRVLSLVILLSQISTGKYTILQGLREFKKLASANIVGSLIGLFLTLPIYYLWGEQGIVPAIILSAVISLSIVIYHTNSLKIKSAIISWSETVQRGRYMIKTGFLISITGIMDMGVIYIVKNMVQVWGSIAEVGLYTAGFAVVQSYVGLIFNSISTDYYPRLIAASMDKEKCQDVINKQFELMILVLTPLVLLFVISSKLILIILYSSKFLDISSMISWIAVGMIFKAYSWCPGFLYLAKNDSVLYFVIYIFTTIFHVATYLALYNFYGLSGIGFGFVVLYIFCSLSTIVIVKMRYGITYSSTSNKLLLFLSIASFITLLLSYVEHWTKYILQLFILFIVCWFCFVQLNNRLDLKSFLQRFKKR